MRVGAHWRVGVLVCCFVLLCVGVVVCRCVMVRGGACGVVLWCAGGVLGLACVSVCVGVHWCALVCIGVYWCAFVCVGVCGWVLINRF